MAPVSGNFALVLVSIDRREILYSAVTANPNSAWVSQQIRNAFWEKDLPRYLLHDQDRNFVGLAQIGTDEIITAKASPWQNAYCERLIGTIRRECTDHFLTLGQRHLSRVLREYSQYYNESRTHLSLEKDAPIPRNIQKIGDVVATPILGGLHFRYNRNQAA